MNIRIHLLWKTSQTFIRSHQYLSLFPSNYNPNIVFLIIDHRQNTIPAGPWASHTTSWSCVSVQHCLWVRYVYIHIHILYYIISYYTYMCRSLSNINHHTQIIILFWEFPQRCLMVINKEIFEWTEYRRNHPNAIFSKVFQFSGSSGNRELSGWNRPQSLQIVLWQNTLTTSFKGRPCITKLFLYV